MKRIPEPELMTEQEQVVTYANADFEEPHNHFIQLLKQSVGEHLPVQGKAVDLGCGAADISIRFVRSFPEYSVDALDGSSAMLVEGRKVLDASSLTEQVNLIETYINESSLVKENYDLIFSNSLLHHLHEPMLLWNCIKNAKGNPSIFIMDLMRPENDERVDWMVNEYASDEPEVLQRDFRASLKAAFTQEEVESQLAQAGLEHLNVSVVSDRHLTISGCSS